jgi:hypothetical protein
MANRSLPLGRGTLGAPSTNLIELSFEGLVSEQVLGRKQREIEVEQARLSDLLAKLEQSVDDRRGNATGAAHPQSSLLQAATDQRR